ncbi:MAG: M23 family metallopeptidase [bacterium]|nr:M23 family metallopeptidase [bacterium]
MKAFIIIFTCCFIAYVIVFGFVSRNTSIAEAWKLPIQTNDRQNWSTVLKDPDAHFKALRAEFGPVKLHYHTGVDIRNKSYDIPGEPVYPIAAGKVIAIEDSPPQRRIVVEHLLPNREKIWSVYIHIIDEQVNVGDAIDTETVMARLMNIAELEIYGQDYHHVHLEIMKKLPPYAAEFYQQKTFTCFTKHEVDEYYFDPELFLKEHFQQK